MSAKSQKIEVTSEKNRPLYFDEALRTLPRDEFARNWASFPRRRPRHQSSNARSA
jgi:hypothetical protein